MATSWETLPIKLKGGLISNLSRLQQGLQAPGSAKVLLNFEPSIKGGYRRINGFQKFDPTLVQPYGSVVVQSSGQSGTTLLVADVHESPNVDDTFVVSGVSGSYLVSAVTYSDTNKTATLTITPGLASSPADRAALTFTSGQSRIEGVHYSSSNAKAYVLRGGCVWSSLGSGWTKVSVPSYGTTLVAGGSQTGSTLDVDGLDSDSYVPQAGDTFSVSGLDLIYTVTVNSSAASGASTLTISPVLDSSPADNATVTFLSSSHSGGLKARFKDFNFNGTFKTAMVDGFNNPSIITSSSYTTLQGSTDVTGAGHVEEFKNHLFFAKNDLVTYTAPFDEESFSTALGAGSYRLPDNCTGLLTYRTQMVNFCETFIRELQGTSSADWVLTSITNDVGCVSSDTIQEVGGDVMFLGPDGVRFLGSTDRIGDFNLSLASRRVQSDFEKFIAAGSEYCAAVVRGKNQYRIFKYSSTTKKKNTLGYIGTQFADQNGQSVEWGTTEGIKAYRASSSYLNDEEVFLFSNDDEYLYRLESGSDFDGVPISSSYHTPFISVNDPTIRKTVYKVDTYFEPESLIEGTLSLKYDFIRPGKIQPTSLVVSGGGVFSFYGASTYGVNTYGGSPETLFENQAVGSFFTVSLQYNFDGGKPFVLDTVVLDYSTEDKK